MSNRGLKMLLATMGLGAPAVLLTTNAEAQIWAKGMAVTSCSANNPGNPVVGIEDLRNPAGTGGALGQVWDNAGTNKAPMTRIWKRGDLGQIFGLALGYPWTGTPDIFAAATDIYPNPAPGSGGTAATYPTAVNGNKHTIYRLRPNGGLSQCSGTCDVFFNVPSVGGNTFVNATSLGQVAFNPKLNIVYASNFDDGIITAITDTGVGFGTLVGTYNHGVAGRVSASLLPIPDTPTTTDVTPPGRRVFAVQYNRAEDRLYYAVYEGANQNTIWSVKLGPTGLPLTTAGSARKELTLSASCNSAYPNDCNEISDIAFTFAGTSMMVAERYRHRNPVTSLFGNARGQVHDAKVLHFAGSTSAWTPAIGNRQPVGNYSTISVANNNSAGGVDYSYEYNAAKNGIELAKPEGRVLATGDALTLNALTKHAYGVQSTATTVATSPWALANHYFIDFNGGITTADKTLVGDVEAWREPLPKEIECCPPFDLPTMKLMLKEDHPGSTMDPYVWKFRTDLTPATATFNQGMQYYFQYMNWNDPTITTLNLFLYLIDCGDSLPAYPTTSNSTTPCGSSPITFMGEYPKTVTWSAGTGPSGVPWLGRYPNPVYNSGIGFPFGYAAYGLATNAIWLQNFFDQGYPVLHPAGIDQSMSVNRRYMVAAIPVVWRAGIGFEFLWEECGLFTHEINDTQSLKTAGPLSRTASKRWSAAEFFGTPAGQQIRRQIEGAAAAPSKGTAVEPRGEPRPAATETAPADSRETPAPTTEGERILRPGELAPNDNEAAALNRDETERMNDVNPDN